MLVLKIENGKKHFYHRVMPLKVAYVIEIVKTSQGQSVCPEQSVQDFRLIMVLSSIGTCIWKSVALSICTHVLVNW